VLRRFWRLIAAGCSTDDACRALGVARNTGGRWFAQAGGMPPLDLGEPSERYLTFGEREEIALHRAAGLGVRAIARELGRDPATISRELKRGCLKRRPRGRYRASVAQARAEQRARRPRRSRLATNPLLRAHVQQALLEGWSPEQIAARLVEDFPDDESMRISHEAIYQALYVQGRGGLRRELTACLRTGRALRKPRRRVDGRGTRRIPDMVLISERPAEADDRAVPGHWEGDLILGASGTSAIGTLVERSTRFVMLLHLPDDHRAETVRDAIVDKITTLPVALRRSLTWDQGTELARHTEITLAADLPIYFCDPHSPWQRGTNENTNGLLRQYFPKGADLATYSPDHLDALSQVRHGGLGRTYYQRKRADGKGHREAMRCLKRQLATVVYRALLADQRLARHSTG
jgi:transposase, IS30 family